MCMFNFPSSRTENERFVYASIFIHILSPYKFAMNVNDKQTPHRHTLFVCVDRHYLEKKSECFFPSSCPIVRFCQSNLIADESCLFFDFILTFFLIWYTKTIKSPNYESLVKQKLNNYYNLVLKCGFRLRLENKFTNI